MALSDTANWCIVAFLFLATFAAGYMIGGARR